MKPEIKRLSPEQRATGQPVKWLGLIANILQFYALFGVIFTAVTFAKVPIMEISPIIPCLLYAFLFVHMNITLMI